MTRSPFDLLARLYPDEEMSGLLDEQATVRGWLRFEGALATAQAKAGLLSDGDAEAIDSVDVAHLDLTALWRDARNVGYPILPMIRQMADLLPAGPAGRIHFGATTQDAMDTGLALTLRDAADLLDTRIFEVGDQLSTLVDAHRETVMPGRTHGQQAVPTTLGAQLASPLAEIARVRRRMAIARRDVAVVSLFGAGGTSAALGPAVGEVRRHLGDILGLEPSDVPWHTSRDSVVALAQSCMLAVGTCGRLARNVIDLSRTEIGELHEAGGRHRGASSTMPQKANPILSEGIVAMSAVVGPLVSALSRALEVPQERAAGEWQIEWHIVPQVLQLTASTLSATHDLVGGLRVDAEAMSRNLEHDGGLVMSEAAMFALAGPLGRERAHDVVYAAVEDVRTNQVPLSEAIESQLRRSGLSADTDPVTADDYLGDVRTACDAARAAWSRSRTDEERVR